MSTRSTHAGNTIRIKTNVKAGNPPQSQHNQARIKTNVKAGGIRNNHNQTRIKTSRI